MSNAEPRYSELRAALKDLVLRVEEYEELEKLAGSRRFRRDHQMALLTEHRREARFDVMIQSLFDAVRNAEAILPARERLAKARAALDEAEDSQP
jgi:hypothetical protein